jgi:ribonucleotide reductase beta subunit family protein with ferritin-like domain
MLLRFQDRSKWRLLYERSKQSYWQPEAIDCQADKYQWLELDSALKHKVLSLLQYAIMLDSYQVQNLQQEGVNTEPGSMLGALLSFHGLMEAVHSQSYSYWAETVCTTKQKEWLYQELPNSVLSRMSAYNKLKTYANPQLANYFLEGVSFQALFRLSDQLKAEGFLPGLSAILNLIKRDEDIHIETFQTILKEGEGLVIKPSYQQLFLEAVQMESQQILQITNDRDLADYVLYIGEVRAKAVGLIDKTSLSNPLKHLESYNDVSKQSLKANFFTSNVSYSQRDESLDWNENNWF